MNPDAHADRLAGGRRAEDVLAQVAGGRGAERDAHQSRCPHCQAALAEYARLWGPIQELSAENVITPEGFLEDALTRIRGAVEHTNYGVLPSPAGVTRIAARVVVVTARETAQAVTGVRVALGKHVLTRAGITDPPGPGGGDGPEVTVGVAGRRYRHRDHGGRRLRAGPAAPR